jgi:hypothetical protein
MEIKNTTECQSSRNSRNKMKILARCNLLIVFFITNFCLSFAQSERDTIRILAIGNSFSEDAVENYLYDIGKADNVVLIIGNMYIGGCSLEKHWSNANNDAAAYSYRKINAQGIKTTTPNVKMSEGVSDEQWDYISFQQVSQYSGLYNTYFPYLSSLKNYVKNLAINTNVEFALHMTWAYAQTSTHTGFANYNKDQTQMYNAIVNTVNRAAETAGVSIVIPAGTAIQNARTTFLGDSFCRDGYHLNTGIGRYIAACTWYEKLTGNTVTKNTYAPASLSNINIEIAQKAAHYAILNPKSITDMSEEYPVLNHETFLLETPVNIDFGGSNTSSHPWNNLSSTAKGSAVGGLVDINGKLTPIAVEVTDAFGGVNTNGPSNSILTLQNWEIPKEAAGDSFFGNAGDIFSGKIVPEGSLLLSKLNTDQSYTLNIFSSRTASDNRESSFKIEGKTEQTFYVNSSSNTTKLIAAEKVTPNADGTIKITVGAGPNNNQANKFFYINAMQIVSGGVSGIENIETTVNIYPNPVSDILHISNADGIKNIDLFDITGEKILQLSGINQNDFQIDCSSLKNGCYLLQSKTMAGNILTGKILKL